MFIRDVNSVDKVIKVSIPLTSGTEKTRIKKRSIFNEYGLPVSTRQKPFTQSCYVEWQIGYDVVVKETEKLAKSTMQNVRFQGANGKEKAFYELSEYIKYFYDWGIIERAKLLEIRDYLLGLSDNDFLDVNEELSIRRSHPIERRINGMNFLWSKVEYPLLVYKFNNYEVITEIVIKEKQYAIGTQPMLYLCFPITELDNSSDLLGRIAEAKEFATFVIDNRNINIFVELLKIFGTLSKNHNKDVLSIINVILN